MLHIIEVLLLYATLRKYDYEKQAAWRQGVMEQVKFKCFLTSETDMSKMQCHHLESWSRSEVVRYYVKN